VLASSASEVDDKNQKAEPSFSEYAKERQMNEGTKLPRKCTYSIDCDLRLRISLYVRGCTCPPRRSSTSMFLVDPAERYQALNISRNENQVQNLPNSSSRLHYQGPASVQGWHLQAIWPTQEEPARPFHSTALPHLRHCCQFRDEGKGWKRRTFGSELWQRSRIVNIFFEGSGFV